MTADTLRRAAGMMRVRATDAAPGPWHTVLGDATFNTSVATRRAGTPTELTSEEWVAEVGPRRAVDAFHIASWHPAVALAVADLLDAQAEMAEKHGEDPLADIVHIARTYLGETP